MCIRDRIITEEKEIEIPMFRPVKVFDEMCIRDRFWLQSAAGHQSVSDTDGGCCLELYSDVKLIILSLIHISHLH